VKRTGVIFAVAAALAVALTAGASGAPSTVSVAQLKSGFKKATGQSLVVDRTGSSPGHYTAFNLGVQTATKQARYGTFTIYLVSGSDTATDVQHLLTNPHTGELGAPAKGGIYWEKGSTMTGTEYWMAKRPYGANVVIWWTTTTPVRKTDRTWTVLHKALTSVTKAG
jgi:hypothetical protein